MLYGRRLDSSLEHVNGSRYALVHAVAKRARQITLWLTADPAELRAESAPPPAAGELISRDPVALAEAEIIDGEIAVRWDPDGRADDIELPDAEIETDPLLLDGLDDETGEGDEGGASPVTPALAQVLGGDGDVDDAVTAEAKVDSGSDEEDTAADGDEPEGVDGGDVSVEEAAERELSESDDEGVDE
jgi:hypothetical protein